MAEVKLEDLKEAHEKLETTLRQWREETLKVVSDYNDAVLTIKATNIRLEATEKKFWNVYKVHIKTVFYLILAIVIVLIFQKINYCGKFDFPFIGGSYQGRNC